MSDDASLPGRDMSSLPAPRRHGVETHGDQAGDGYDGVEIDGDVVLVPPGLREEPSRKVDQW